MRTDWSPLVRAILMPTAGVLALALVCIVVAATGRSSSIATVRRSALLIGDSLSVGKFGEVIRAYLVSNFGPQNVAVYASCGSSPEHWLRAEPTFSSKCGYREQTTTRNIVMESNRGHATPKIEELIARHRPGTVIVQLGTNWMDRLAISDTPQKEAEFSSILDRFVAALRHQPGGVTIIWVTPPDSSRFSQKVQRTVENLIRNAAIRNRFEIINSREMTRYIPGKTGGDGVHYNSQASTDWANRVIIRLKRQYRWSAVAY